MRMDVPPAFKIGVIADDITGALDTGVQFAEAGLATALLLGLGSELPGRFESVQVLSTDSRDGDATSAWRRAAQAAGRLRGRRLYKKIDSTMRGHVGSEIEAILQATARETTVPARAVVCPAVIGQGRTVRRGLLWVGDVLLHESDFGRDPTWPARTSDLGALLGMPATHLSLDIVRAGPEPLAEAILNAPTSIATVDAVQEIDIQNVARAAVLGRCLPCGALGLARAWIECLLADHLVTAQRTGDRTIPTRALGPKRSANPILVVAGSRHPVTRAQLRHAASARELVTVEAAAVDGTQQARCWATIAGALADNRSVVVRSPLHDIEPAGERRALIETMAGWAQRAGREFELGGLVLTGGETALAVCRALGATAIDIRGELETGIPWGQLAGGRAPGMQVVTKAGGFGRPDSLLHVLDALHLRQE